VLDGQDMELLQLVLEGDELGPDRYQVDADSLTIAHVPGAFVLEVTTRLRPQSNTSLEGLYRSGELFCTQCEAEGFRRITYFLDRPDVMARYTTRITADKQGCPVMLANGNLTDSGDLPDGRHYAVWTDPFPKPCYLFAMVAGDLRWVQDQFTTRSGRPVDLRIYVEPENIDKCGHAMASLKHAMTWDELEFGREYDLDHYMIVAVNAFNMGAMENKGLNIFNAKYVLARPETATDRDFQNIEGVIAHEYFHNWTGNRITCRDWFQLSLKEGLTVFRDQEFSADMGSRGVKRIQDVRGLRAHQFPEDAGPMAHPVRPDSYMEINNFYTATVYNKGAEVIRMQRNLLGGQGFRRGMDLYFERHDGQAVTTDDFVRCMEDANGMDLTQFRRWYTQAGTPVVQVTGHYEADLHRYSLTLIQSCPPTPGQPTKQPFHIPVAMGLLDPDGRDMALQLEGEEAPRGTTRVLEVKDAMQTFHFVNVPFLPLPSLLRGFSAPVKLRFDYTDDDLVFLMAHDSDPFNRWDAAQGLATRIILRMVAARSAGQPMEVPAGFVEAFARTLVAESQDRDLRTQVLTLPGESYLGDQLQVVDVDGIHAAREQLRRHVAEALEGPLRQGYDRSLGELGRYAPDAEGIGRRSLRNLCLDYLMALDRADIRALALSQFRAADNMTDSLAALGLLADTVSVEADTALVEFYRRWQADPLVLDKWFGIQALSRRSDALSRVRDLVSHPRFELRNPNRVRALIGAFTQNVVRFHAPDGSGYQFLADHVAALDPINPQVAARLASPFTRWQRYDPGRQNLMRRQLERLMGLEQVSEDLYEVASKSLAAADA
jgi:aminopeptidase N